MKIFMLLCCFLRLFTQQSIRQSCHVETERSGRVPVKGNNLYTFNSDTRTLFSRYPTLSIFIFPCEACHGTLSSWNIKEKLPKCLQWLLLIRDVYRIYINDINILPYFNQEFYPLGYTISKFIFSHWFI